MQLTIHRGAHEIGGSCIEIKSSKTRILLDIGVPLNSDTLNFSKSFSKNDFKNKNLRPNIEGLYECPSFDAILISHAHIDHFGLISHVHPDIPVYMSKGTEKLINLTSVFNDFPDIPNVRTIMPWKPFFINDIKITAYLMDHSCFDSFGYLIEVDNKRLFYTGDFRAHGRKKILFDKLINNPPRNIDYLITEGTMLSRENEIHKTEDSVEQELIDYLKQDSMLTLFSCSSQNIDRLVSAYRACLQTNTLLIIDPYTASVLDCLKEISGNIPQFDWESEIIKIFFIPNSYTEKTLNKLGHYKFKKSIIKLDEIASLKQKMLIKDSYTMRRILKNKNLLSDRTLIYSQWDGYLDEKLKHFWETNDVTVKHLHTSGHAYTCDIKKLVDALNPNFIIPIHTDNLSKFIELYPTKTLFLQDGENINF